MARARTLAVMLLCGVLGGGCGGGSSSSEPATPTASPSAILTSTSVPVQATSTRTATATASSTRAVDTPPPTATASPTPTPTGAVPSPTATCFFPPHPTPVVAFQVEPETPRVGDTVQVSGLITTNAGPPGECSVSGATPVFDEVHVTRCAGGLGGGAVMFDMKAAQAGSATITVGFSFEIPVQICGGNVTYQFAHGTADLTVAVAAADPPP